jgi:hypothetical protein
VGSDGGTYGGDERVVDGDDVDRRVLGGRTEGEAADAAEAVDANVDGHVVVEDGEDVEVRECGAAKETES